VMSPEFSVRSGRIGIGLDGIHRTSPLAIAQMGGMLAIFGALSTGGRVTGLQTAVRVGAFICGALLALFSGTRGQAVFALFAIAMFLPVSRRLKNIGSYFSLVGVGAVVAIGAYVTFNYVLGQADTDRWQVASIADATAIRQWSFFQLMGEFVQSPQAWLVGLGYNAFSTLEGVGDLGYVHNLYAEVLCELGLPAFVLLVVLFVKTWKASLALFRRYREHPAERSAVAILMAMMVYQALISTKEGTLWSAWVLFTFALVIIRLESRAQVLGDLAFEEEQALLETESHESFEEPPRERLEGGHPA